MAKYYMMNVPPRSKPMMGEKRMVPYIKLDGELLYYMFVGIHEWIECHHPPSFREILRDAYPVPALQVLLEVGTL